MAHVKFPTLPRGTGRSLVSDTNATSSFCVRTHHPHKLHAYQRATGRRAVDHRVMEVVGLETQNSLWRLPSRSTWSKHVKPAAHGPHASFIWPVLALEFDMLALEGFPSIPRTRPALTVVLTLGRCRMTAPTAAGRPAPWRPWPVPGNVCVRLVRLSFHSPSSPSRPRGSHLRRRAEGGVRLRTRWGSVWR